MAITNFFVDEKYGESYFIGGQITHQWIIECLDNNDNDFKEYRGDNKIKNINGVDISDGKGFLSKVFKTSIFFDDEKKKPYYTIIKIPGSDSIVESLKKQNLDDTISDDFNIENIAAFHNKECLFYSEVAPKIKSLKYPKCFGFKNFEVGKQAGVLIMKFMGTTSKTVPFYISLNIYQIKSLLDEIYKLQEYSLIDSKNCWKGIFEKPFESCQFKNIQKYMETGLPKIKKYTPKEMWTDIENIVDILVSNYVEIAEYVYNILPTSKGNVPILAHGDMWINNFMFEVDGNNNCSNNLSAIIDWQTVFEGSTGNDISRALAVSASPDVRREIEKHYFPEFYQKLKHSISNNGKELMISYEKFLYNYKICFIEQSLMMLIMVGFALQEYNVPESSDYIWDARKFNIGVKICYNLYDAITYCKELHPEWLENKH
uniref:CHK domain-containing protein n=1 Tax=Strongyloides stercoralis TaxID=6248 RepID=A0A0K0EL40_STRER